MSNTKSDSSESISIYETPINSPSNESLLDSTRIDSSLFDNISANTQSIDILDFHQSFESIRTSAATESTLRQTVQRLNTECSEDKRDFPQLTDVLIPDSVFYSSQTMSDLKNHLLDSNRSDLYVMLMKYMSELEGEQLELIGVEQQMRSLSIKCRTIRENMSSKTHAITSIIHEMLPKMKQTAQKQTQTDLEESQSDPHSCDENKLTFSSFKSEPLFPKSTSSVLSEPKIEAKTDSLKNNFCELSESQKRRLNRLPAMVRGYLTRRLMKTDKVLQKIELIRETTQLLSNYRNTPSSKKITPEDINFHSRLIIQLEKSCHEFHDIFFNYPKSSQMDLIRHSREHILERHYRTVSVLSNSSYLNASFRNQGSAQINSLSSATKRVIQRKTKKSTTNSISSQSKNTIQNSSATKNRTLVSGQVPFKSNSSLRRSQRSTATNAVQTHKRKANFDNK